MGGGDGESSIKFIFLHFSALDVAENIFLLFSQRDHNVLNSFGLVLDQNKVKNLSPKMVLLIFHLFRKLYFGYFSHVEMTSIKNVEVMLYRLRSKIRLVNRMLIP